MNIKNKHNLKIEIAIALIVKFILLCLIWLICFSHPIEKQLTTKKMQQHWFNQTKPPLT